MNILSSLLSIFIPISDSCYLHNNIIDARNNHNLKQAAIQLASREGISITEAEQYFMCIPNNGYTYQRASSKNTNSAPLYKFRKAVISPYRVKQGALFYKNNHNTLMDVSNKYGIDPYIITAIIGVESNYGNYTGTHNVKQSLATILSQLSKGETIDVGIPNLNEEIDMIKVDRKAFFTNELVSLIHLERKYGLDIKHLNGSWDGGIGLPQFMPSSYSEYAISPIHSFPDLFDPNDAISSVANYLKNRGKWNSGPIAQQLDPADVNQELFTRNHYSDQPHQKIYRFLLPDGQHEYWRTFHNFDAIMTYNTRPHYALCIHQLANQIHEYTEQQT